MGRSAAGFPYAQSTMRRGPGYGIKRCCSAFKRGVKSAGFCRQLPRTLAPTSVRSLRFFVIKDTDILQHTIQHDLRMGCRIVLL